MSGLDTRERVLRVLYEVEQSDLPPDLEPLGPKARRLVEGVLEHADQLDQALGAVSPRWRVDRMPLVDRNLLRLGLFELRHEPGTPTAVIISEAVRLAKRYSTDRSGAFVNGVLARLAEEERRAAH